MLEIFFWITIGITDTVHNYVLQCSATYAVTEYGTRPTGKCIFHPDRPGSISDLGLSDAPRVAHGVG